MKIGEIKKKNYEKFEIPFKDMDLGDSVDINLEGISNVEAEDYQTLIERLAAEQGVEGKYGARVPGFMVRFIPQRNMDQCPIIHICRIA